MSTDEFVRNFRLQKDQLMKAYFSAPPSTSVAKRIQDMSLTPEQSQQIRFALDEALTDAFYTILLGLDGCTRIGDAKQQNYRIIDEDGSEISAGGGEIEALAFHYFQEPSSGEPKA